MISKLSYEELEQRVKELEKAANDRGSLEKQLRFLSLAVEQSSEGLAVVDLDGNLEYLNHAFAKMHGYSAKKLIGKNLSIFHTPEQMPSVIAANKQLKETGQFIGEIWHVKIDGTSFPTLMHNSLLKDEDGHPIGMIGTLRDISDIKQVEDELRKSHDKLEKRVKERAAELVKANEQLQMEIDERRRTEKDLTIFRSFAEESRQALGMADLDGDIVYCNLALCKILGEKSPMDAIGKNVRSYYSEELRHELENEILPTVIEKGQWVGELPLLSIKGNLTPAIQSIFLIRDDDAKPLYLANVITDITDKKRAEEALQKAHDELEQRVEERTTDLVIANQKLKNEIEERKQAEEALRESEKRFRETIELLPSIICEYDTKGRFTYVNPYGLESFGYKISDMEHGLYATQLFPPDEISKFKDRFNLLLRGEKQESTEYCLQRKDGSTIYVIANSAPIYKDGKIIGARSSITSITERKQIEAALGESEKRYRLLADNVTDVIWVRDMNLRLTYVSPSIVRQTGYTVEESMARTLEGSLSSDSFKLVKNVLAEELEIEKREQKDLFRSRTIELEIKCKDGSTIWTEVKMSFLRDQLGNPTGVIGVTRDITDRKHLEAQLQQAQRMEAIGTLAGGVAHDLNNILSGIVSYPELILMDLPEGSPLKKPILTMQKSGEKAAVIVQDLLTLARRGVSITDVVNLNHIISEQLQSPEFEKLISFHPDVQVKTNLEKDLLNIKGSFTHLSKSVMNILSNAAEAMPGGGTILLSTENLYLDRPIKGYNHVESGEYVTVTFSDTGMGIPEEDAKRIFEPFYTKKVMGRSGTGLGMAVVWGTVKDHKGYIDIQSMVGKGTTFTLYFPVTREEIAKDESLLPIVDYMGKGELILVVDDVEEQREIATGMLRKLGYSVTSVSSGEEAVEYLKTNSADLIVLDMIMEPGINGRETYERITQFHPHQKAIIASGFSETDDVKTAQRLGAGKYIKKPYTLEKIGIAVRDELKK